MRVCRLGRVRCPGASLLLEVRSTPLNQFFSLSLSLSACISSILVCYIAPGRGPFCKSWASRNVRHLTLPASSATAVEGPTSREIVVRAVFAPFRWLALPLPKIARLLLSFNHHHKRSRVQRRLQKPFQEPLEANQPLCRRKATRS